jgi:formiminotetrahydrofolate cyclodeaminase
MHEPTPAARDLSGVRDRTLTEFSDLVASAAVAPGAGAVAAVAVDLAAGLVAKAARASSSWELGEGVGAQAQALRRRAAPQADLGTQAFADAVEALAARTGESGADASLGDALARAAEVPLAILETAVAVAQLAAEVADHGDAEHRPEAVGACLLAEAAAQTCAHLVHVNLATQDGDQRAQRATSLARSARQARDRASSR